METAYLRPRDPYGAGLAPGAGPAPSVSVINNMKHATFPRSARAERESSGGSPRKPPPQPSCDCCPYGYHIDLDFVRFCERLAGAGGGSASQSATKARRRERRRQRQSMDVLLGLAAPPDQPQVWTIEQTLPQLPPSPVSLPPHASMLVRDALQRAVKDFEEALERSSPATVSLSPLPALPVLPATPATPPPRVPPRRYQLESVSTCGHHARESSSSPGGRAAGQAAGQAVNARILEQALDAGLWAAASAAPAAPALQNIRQQIARSLERMRELEEEVKMIPVLQVQLSVMQEEKRKMLLQIRKSQPTIKQNGVSHTHLDVLKIEEPVRNGAPPAPPPRPTSLDGLGPAVNGTGPAGPMGPKRRPASVRDVGVGCTVLTRDVGLMPPPPRLRTVAVGTDPVRSEEAQPSPNRLSKSSVYTEDIPYVPPRTSARGVQTAATDAASRGCQTDTQPAPPPPARPTTRDTGVQVQPASVQPTHAGVTARPSTADAGVSCAPRTRDAASSDCTVDDVLCAGCRARQGVRTRSVGVETTPVRAEAEAGSRMCLSLSALDAAPTPAAVPVPAAPKPQTRTVGCGTASDRAGPFAVNRGVNTDAVVAAVAVHRGVNTDAVPAPTKPTTVSRAVLADLRAATASRATSTDTPRTATTSRATNTDARAATAARATNTEGVPRRDAGTATVRRQTVDAGITCSLVDPARLAAPSHTTAAARAPSPAPPSTPTTPTPQSRIPRPSSTTPQTSPGPPPRRQFKRQDTYTKEPQPAPPALPALPTPAADVTSKSPRQPPCPADAASRKSSAVAPAAPSTPRRQHRQQQQQQRQQQRQHPPLESESEDSEAEQAVAQADEDLQAHSKPKPIPGEPRIKSEPSKEMAAALKVLDDHLQMKSTPRPGAAVPQELRNAFSIAQLEWFKVSSTKSADPLEVEDYLDYLELKSTALLEYVINMTDNSGNTAMHYAVSHGNFDVVSVLLDSKVCNVDVTNTAGYTSVMLVSLAQIRSETHRHVVRRLFHLADVNSRAKQHGQTALMLAVSHGRLDTVRLLLEAGADVNIQDEDGSTALMCAAEHGHLDIIKLLLAQPDCDVTVVDHDGSTALGIAMEAGHRDIGVLLYAQEHFSRGSSPYNSLKMRRARSVTPTARPLSGSGLPTALPAASASPAASAGTPPPARRTPTGPPPAPAPPARGKTS